MLIFQESLCGCVLYDCILLERLNCLQVTFHVALPDPDHLVDSIMSNMTDRTPTQNMQ